MQRSNKIEPSVLRLGFSIPSSSINGTHYIDLSQCASIVNRRFYRQGLNWAVAGFKVNVQNTAATANVTVSKLPNTWVMANAWEKGMRTWTRMIREAVEEAPSIRPRFLDFKIYADATHHSAGSANNLLPWSYGAQFQPGEWDYSTYEIPVSNVDPTLPAGNSVTRDVMAVGQQYVLPGASGNYAVGLIEGYAASRALPNIADPNMPDDASSASGPAAQNWQVALFNEGTNQDAEVLEDLQLQNNQAPYPFENDGVNIDTMYPNGANQAPGLEVVDQNYVSATTIGGTTRLQGSNFPCGLIRLDVFGFESDTEIYIDLIPGSHRGYLCEPMTEM
ncbi:hypothetical protein N9121_03365 [Pseudomonadales bacterium]|nr:hypothetical protein [Pseudomonadales bacterium]